MQADAFPAEMGDRSTASSKKTVAVALIDNHANALAGSYDKVAPVKISVITTVRNARTTIGDAIESVAAQQYSNIEHIVIDGASTDGTLQLLEQHREKLGVLVSEPDRGIYDALNKGIQRASGEVLGFLHADDVFAGPGVLARVAKEFESPNVDAVYGDLVYVRRTDTSHVIRYWRAGRASARSVRWGWMPPHPTLYVRRSKYASVGLFNTEYRIAADYDLMLRLLTSDGFRMSYIPEILVKMRVGGASNRSLRNIIRKSAEDYRILRRHRVGGLGALALKNVRKLHQFVQKDPVPPEPVEP